MPESSVQDPVSAHSRSSAGSESAANPAARSPRIAVFIPSLRGGGAEKAMLLFAEGLLQREYSVDLLVAQYAGPLVDQIPPGVRVIDFAEKHVSRTLPKLIRYLRHEEPAAIFSTIVNANIAALVAVSWINRTSRKPIRVIVRESNVLAPKGRVSLPRRISGAIAPRLYARADKVIAVSRDVAAELCASAPALKSKVVVLPNPVISERLAELSVSPVNHPWCTVSDPFPIPLIVGAGRLHPQKDFSTLIDAFALLCKTRPARLIILGDGAERAKLETQIRRLGLEHAISLPGFMANPFPYLKRADTFVLSSVYEGMPNVLLQAMALGTPVVATRCHSGAQEVLVSSAFGELVEPGDAPRMAEAIARCLEIPRNDEAARFVTERFSVKHATAEYLRAAGFV